MKDVMIRLQPRGQAGAVAGCQRHLRWGVMMYVAHMGRKEVQERRAVGY